MRKNISNDEMAISVILHKSYIGLNIEIDGNVFEGNNNCYNTLDITLEDIYNECCEEFIDVDFDTYIATITIRVLVEEQFRKKDFKFPLYRICGKHQNINFANYTNISPIINELSTTSGKNYYKIYPPYGSAYIRVNIDIALNLLTSASKVTILIGTKKNYQLIYKNQIGKHDIYLSEWFPSHWKLWTDIEIEGYVGVCSIITTISAVIY